LAARVGRGARGRWGAHALPNFGSDAALCPPPSHPLLAQLGVHLQGEARGRWQQVPRDLGQGLPASRKQRCGAREVRKEPASEVDWRPRSRHALPEPSLSARTSRHVWRSGSSYRSRIYQSHLAAGRASLAPSSSLVSSSTHAALARARGARHNGAPVDAAHGEGSLGLWPGGATETAAYGATAHA